MLLKLEALFDRFSDVMGWIAGILNLAMLCNVFYDAIMRYFFSRGSIAMQEMEWHLFAMVFLFGIAYGLKEDGHVRVDVLYDSLSPRTKAIINIAGTEKNIVIIFLANGYRRDEFKFVCPCTTIGKS